MFSIAYSRCHKCLFPYDGNFRNWPNVQWQNHNNLELSSPTFTRSFSMFGSKTDDVGMITLWMDVQSVSYDCRKHSDYVWWWILATSGKFNRNPSNSIYIDNILMRWTNVISYLDWACDLFECTWSVWIKWVIVYGSIIRSNRIF